MGIKTIMITWLLIQLVVSSSALPCSAGKQKVDGGCRTCPRNTYSLEGDDSCTACPHNKMSHAGSTSETDCMFVAVSGTSVPTSAGVKNYLDRALVPGDVITAWGVYATGSSNFNVNLMKENGQDFMIHIDFRPPPSENKVVLNSKKNGLSELEIRTPIPAFVNNGAFKVEVKCLQDEFEISVDGNVLTSRFPYRDGFPLSDVKFVWLLGGSNGMEWTDIALPRDLPQAVITAAWRRISGGLRRISEGNSGVWGVNSGGNIYRLNSNGNSWTRISGGLVQVSSGASIWGVNSGGAIFKYLGGNSWQNIPGALTNVDVSNSDHVWGVNRGQAIWRRIGDNWERIGGKAIQVSVGEAGVWVVNAANNIYYRNGTYGDPDTAGSGWVQVFGKLKWVGSGKDILVGVNSNDDIYYRLGMSSSSPTGTGWKKVSGKLMQIDVQYDNRVVGTNSGNAIFESPVTRAAVCINKKGDRNCERMEKRGLCTDFDVGHCVLELCAKTCGSC